MLQVQPCHPGTLAPGSRCQTDLEPVGHDDDGGVGDGAEQLLGGSLLLLPVVLLLHL